MRIDWGTIVIFVSGAILSGYAVIAYLQRKARRDVLVFAVFGAMMLLASVLAALDW